MLRSLSGLFFAACFTVFLTGCSGGGTGEYDPATQGGGMTEERIQENLDYEEMMKQQAAENEDSSK